MKRPALQNKQIAVLGMAFRDFRETSPRAQLFKTTMTMQENNAVIGWRRQTILLHVLHFSTILWRSLPNDNVKFPNVKACLN